MMSDESENDCVYTESYENDVYYKKYKLLSERCESLQKNNERLIFRIQQVKKITRRRYNQVRFMKERLLKYYDENWAVIPAQTFPEIDDVKIKVEPDEKLANIEIKTEIKPEKSKTVKRAPKRKSTKSEKDPNAPKRPSNPFFQFCQEQRQILMEQLNSDLKPGETEPTKQELTRQLALKWKSLSPPDKKIYIDMYERSKEKYVVEMSEYNLKK